MLKINTEKAPAAIGPYTQAIRQENVLYTSGQIGIDPATGALVPGGVREQAEQVMKNLLEVLPITFFAVDRGLADLTAEFKSRYSLSLADACAAALAQQLKAELYTDDDEFDALVPEIRLCRLCP